MSDAPQNEVPDEGALDPISVPDLLALAWRDRRSGCLQLAQGQSERLITVRNGAPLQIECARAEDRFAEFLADARLISAADRNRVEEKASERECPQATAVLALKLLEPSELYRAMRKHARIRIAEAFEWRVGMYRWTAAEVESITAKPYDILSILQQELPRRWGTERLFTTMMSVQDLRGDISPRFRRVAEKMASAGPFAQQAIERLDGRTPVGQILGDCAGDPLAAATLWTLFRSGVMRQSDGSATAEVEALSFEVEVTAVETAQGNGPGANDRADGKTLDAKTQAKADGLREEIGALLADLGNLDHYSALGLTSEDGPAEIKKAYFKAAKKYHPDSLARLGLDDLKEDAAQVFARIAEAFETLSDPEKKAAYDSSGTEEPEIDMARLAQAETSFRKGEILAKMGNFDGALEYLVPAVELWPDEPAYQAGLGWALFKQPKSDADRAAEHLEIAMGQAPDDALIAYRLGLIMRAQGETHRANALIAAAREIDPSVDE